MMITDIVNKSEILALGHNMDKGVSGFPTSKLENILTFHTLVAVSHQNEVVPQFQACVKFLGVGSEIGKSLLIERGSGSFFYRSEVC